MSICLEPVPKIANLPGFDDVTGSDHLYYAIDPKHCTNRDDAIYSTTELGVAEVHVCVADLTTYESPTSLLSTLSKVVSVGCEQSQQVPDRISVKHSLGAGNSSAGSRAIRYSMLFSGQDYALTGIERVAVPVRNMTYAGFAKSFRNGMPDSHAIVDGARIISRQIPHELNASTRFDGETAKRVVAAHAIATNLCLTQYAIENSAPIIFRGTGPSGTVQYCTEPNAHTLFGASSYSTHTSPLFKACDRVNQANVVAMAENRPLPFSPRIVEEIKDLLNVCDAAMAMKARSKSRRQ